jgi:malate dehydrogenase (oxaloacetate-decarboxylating)
MNNDEKALALHLKKKGKLAVALKDTLDSKEKLGIYYTPGVGAVSSYIDKHPSEAKNYTWLNNNLAVISDGSAVLGLGDIGPLASLPVMEGKCMLFKNFADIDAVPIILDVHSVDEIVATIKAIAPSFGAINLEDIKAPGCFEIEKRLIDELNIPVMHDDQHGTAVVVLAGLINASKITGKPLSESKVVISGAGAAGVAVAKLIYDYSKANITTVDSKGILSSGREDLNPEKKYLASLNKINHSGSTIQDALKDADIFIGVSVAGLLKQKDIELMAKDPVIMAMANPVPEIMPDEAKLGGASIIATGRSDFPNQINNVLAFPGIFRGALDHGIKKITEVHKIAAAEALAGLVKNPTPEEIIPNIFNPDIVPAISAVIT